VVSVARHFAGGVDAKIIHVEGTGEKGWAVWSWGQTPLGKGYKKERVPLQNLVAVACWQKGKISKKGRNGRDA